MALSTPLAFLQSFLALSFFAASSSINFYFRSVSKRALAVWVFVNVSSGLTFSFLLAVKGINLLTRLKNESFFFLEGFYASNFSFFSLFCSIVFYTAF